MLDFRRIAIWDGRSKWLGAMSKRIGQARLAARSIVFPVKDKFTILGNERELFLRDVLSDDLVDGWLCLGKFMHNLE